uniref:Uncharacterized protein n=1 Tax=Chromera velia CCMP2878 TaxID=1169474 RepID=A0A0G4I0C5_9ALVE|eukprot:Cvel_9894.t1-p1 / transcript=Cvel_9894.t1 / gene=Cvel_9894 / organism=Chromera_velia_CCMP2878 / gene_product=hypothetical protein / transcript_product=hypothetical protein / location=Cvel_scaffold584:3092-4735(-) / protein_length=548 / sequence_SO=supercontig / SO=protein_coding / is_pseudo=false
MISVVVGVLFAGWLLWPWLCLLSGSKDEHQASDLNTTQSLDQKRVKEGVGQGVDIGVKRAQQLQSRLLSDAAEKRAQQQTSKATARAPQEQAAQKDEEDVAKKAQRYLARPLLIGCPQLSLQAKDQLADENSFRTFCAELVRTLECLIAADIPSPKLFASLATLKELTHNVLMNLHAPKRFLRLNTQNKKLREKLALDLCDQPQDVLRLCDFLLVDGPPPAEDKDKEHVEHQTASFSVTKLLLLKQLLQQCEKTLHDRARSRVAGSAALARFFGTRPDSLSVAAGGMGGGASLCPQPDQLGPRRALIRLYQQELFPQWDDLFDASWAAARLDLLEIFGKRGTAGAPPSLPSRPKGTATTQLEAGVEVQLRHLLKEELTGVGGGEKNGEDGQAQCTAHSGLIHLARFVLHRRFADAVACGIQLKAEETKGMRVEGKRRVHEDFVRKFFRVTRDDIEALLPLLPLPSGLRCVPLTVGKNLPPSVFFQAAELKQNAENEKKIAQEVLQEWRGSDAFQGLGGRQGCSSFIGVACVLDSLEGTGAALAIVVTE